MVILNRATVVLSIVNMIVPYKALHTNIKKSFASIYILIGQDDFLLDDATQQIKAAWRGRFHDPDNPYALDQHYLEITDSDKEWQALKTELNSYSLFSQQTCYQVRFLKKSLDKSAKAHLMELAEQNEPSNILILQAPQCKAKDLQMFKNHNKVMVVQIWPLKPHEFVQWIFSELKRVFPNASQDMARLIAQYTRANLYAATQVIKKLSLLLGHSEKLTVEQIQTQLHNQCEFQNFELSDACLNGDAHTAIQILRLNNKASESPLLLWILSNELRLLLRLKLNTQHMTWAEACRTLNIWNTKSGLYQAACQRLDVSILQQLHHHCLVADRYLKTGQQQMLHNMLEQIALGICKNYIEVLYE